MSHAFLAELAPKATLTSARMVSESGIGTCLQFLPFQCCTVTAGVPPAGGSAVQVDQALAGPEREKSLDHEPLAVPTFFTTRHDGVVAPLAGVTAPASVSAAAPASARLP